LEKRLKITLLDVLIITLIAGACVWLFNRIWVELSYQWNWSAIPQYLFRYDPEKGSFVPNVLMKGFLTTVKLSIWTMVLATTLGLVMALLRLSRSLFRRMIGRTYVELIRNMPPLVLVFILYFFVSDQILSLLGIEKIMQSLSPSAQRFLTCCFSTPAQFPVFASGLITLVLYEGAYITEIIRAGILSIEKGQWEASSAMGLSKWQQMRHVIFPQATVRILPPLAGQLISTIKDSAIVSVISIQELTFQGMELMAATYLTFEVWITITALYFILTFGLSLGVRRLEVSMHRY